MGLLKNYIKFMHIGIWIILILLAFFIGYGMTKSGMSEEEVEQFVGNELYDDHRENEKKFREQMGFIYSLQRQIGLKDVSESVYIFGSEYELYNSVNDKIAELKKSIRKIEALEKFLSIEYVEGRTVSKEVEAEYKKIIKAK